LHSSFDNLTYKIIYKAIYKPIYKATGNTDFRIKPSFGNSACHSFGLAISHLLPLSLLSKKQFLSKNRHNFNRRALLLRILIDSHA